MSCGADGRLYRQLAPFGRTGPHGRHHPPRRRRSHDRPGRAHHRARAHRLLTLFLLFDSVTKLMQLPPVVDATVQMGFPAATVPVIGGVLLVCLALYLVPRTSVLGAVLLTGYLGGASARSCGSAPRCSPTRWYRSTPAWLSGWRLYLRSAALRALIRAGS